MKYQQIILNLTYDQCLLVENRDQYEAIYNNLGSAERYENLKAWEKKYYKLKETDFPKYIMKVHHIKRGEIYTTSLEPKNMIGNQLEVINFNDLLS